MLNLIPPLLSKASLVVSVLPSAPKLILLLNLSFTDFNWSSVAAWPDVKFVGSNVKFCKPPILPVLALSVML